MGKLTYKSAGVDIKRADDFLNQAKVFIGKTFRPGVLTEIGHFGAFFAPNLKGIKEPVIVSSTDGVGTKLKVAQMCGIHSTVGQDLVNHCVNDIMCAGAVPMFFMDYLAMGKLESSTALDLISGICKAADENDTSVVGGETAEMPGLYKEGEYDIAGTIVGITDKCDIISGDSIKAGDALIGLISTGLHTNGYSLARKICFEVKGFNHDSYIEELSRSIGEELLKIHRSYLKTVTELKKTVTIKGLSHITGGGIAGNTSRIIPKSVKLSIDWDSWETPVIFELLKKWGELDDGEMRQAFNLGIGLIIIVEKGAVDTAVNLLKGLDEKPTIIGEIV